MNLAMYNLPSNLKSSLHKTWQALLSFLKPLQIHHLKRKKWGTWHIISPPPEKVKIFTVLNILFTFRMFNNLRLPWKQSFLWNFSLYLIYFLPFRIFEQLCACPEKQSCPGIFQCIEYTFYIQEFWATCMRLPWKTEGALNSQYWLYIFYHSGFLSNLRFPCKTELPWNFSLYWNIFYHSEFLSNLRLPWKTELPWYFSLYLNMYFLSFRIFEQLALALKKRVAQKLFAVWNILFTFWIFEQLALALKNQFAQKFFAVWNALFTFWIFEQLALALKNRGCPEFTILNVFFLLFRIFEQLALALKNRGCPENFHCIEYIFYYSGVLSNLRLPWKQSCPGIFHCIEYTFTFRIF